MRRIGLTLCGFAFALSLAACGGSGANPPLDVKNQQIPTASAQQKIVAAAGGTITVSSGSRQLRVTIPAHALRADATVAVASFLGAPPRPSGAAGALPPGATFLGGFTISTGGVALNAPIAVSETLAQAGSGNLYLAEYSAQAGRYTPVDTATWKDGTIATDGAKNYVSVSTATGQAAPYAFYSSASTSTPPPIALSIVAASPPPYAIGTSVQVTATGADANGNGYAYTPSFTLSSQSLGTLTPSATNPAAAVLTFGNVQSSGSIDVTDAKTALHGTMNLSVQSQRPAAGGDTFAYAGTLTQTFVRTLPSPMPTWSATSTVSQSVTVKDNQTFRGVSNLYDFVTSETDAGTLQTTTSQTDSFVGVSASTPAAFVQYGSSWADENGDTLSYVYPAPLTLDMLPEAAGQHWTNSPSAIVNENESNGAQGAAFSAQRTYNSDGTYDETSTYPPGYFGVGSPSDHGHIVENRDGSGAYNAPIYGAGSILYSAPTDNGSGPQITFSVYAEASPGPTSVPLVSGQIPAWYSAPPQLYAESDSDNGVKPIPSSCNASSTFGANAEQLVQTISRTDTVLGYTEKTSTTTYVALGYGVVCTQMADTLSDYYDFNGDSLFLFYEQPYQVTTTTETLGLQASGTTVIGASANASTRRTAARTAYSIAARTAFMQLLQRRRMRRADAFARSLQHFVSTHKEGLR